MANQPEQRRYKKPFADTPQERATAPPRSPTRDRGQRLSFVLRISPDGQLLVDIVAQFAQTMEETSGRARRSTVARRHDRRRLIGWCRQVCHREAARVGRVHARRRAEPRRGGSVSTSSSRIATAAIRSARGAPTASSRRACSACTISRRSTPVKDNDGRQRQIRMYNVGFGDAFMLMFPGRHGRGGS